MSRSVAAYVHEWARTGASAAPAVDADAFGSHPFFRFFFPSAPSRISPRIMEGRITSMRGTPSPKQ